LCFFEIIAHSRYNTTYDADDEFEEYTGSTHEHIHSEWFIHVYSALAGAMPDGNTTYETGYSNFPLSAADFNSDGFITLDEAHRRANEFDSKQNIFKWRAGGSGDDPKLSNSGLASKTTIAYPYIITSNITSNKTYKGIIGINKNIHITSGKTLTLGANARLELVGNSSLIVDAGATLVLNAATIVGNNPNNKIQVNGSLQATNNTTFKTENGNNWGGLVLSSNSNVSLNNCSFKNVELTGYANSLTITNNSDFENSKIWYTKGNLTVQNSDFVNTQIRATSALSTSEVQINNCEVSGYNYSAIYINSYRKFTIEDCNIHDNGYNGVYVYNAGIIGGLIKGNTISNNGTGSHAGIRLYNSHANIYDNSIMNNRYGIMCLGNSITSILGDENATDKTELQQIRENEINQIYASSTSFPDEIHYNYIDCYNFTDPFIYLAGTPPPEGSLNVEYNYWGRRNVTSDDFYPFTSYDYLPRIIYVFPMKVALDKALYKQAQASKETGDYTNATKQFKQVVECYPESIFTEPSLIELLAVEELGAQNYNSLKQHYLNDKTIGKYKNLKKLADKLSNYCNLKQKNYSKAIDWFEKEIENPETLEDSVFAIIDLGYTYFLMGDKKSAYTGKRAEFKFESVAKYEQKREELIDLLFDQKTNNAATDDTEIEEQESIKLNSETNFKIFPNPFIHETQILYSLSKPAQVLIRVFDYSGKEIKVLVNTYQDKGNYQQTFKADNLIPGIYFYSVELNSKLVTTNKMVIIE